MTIKGSIKHGHARRNKQSSEWNSWRGMIERCTNPRHVGHKYYSKVKVCKRWRKSFAAFLADMGLKPSPRHTLDRYPKRHGNYTPNNCRWATPRQQRLNQRPYDESARVRKTWETRSRICKTRINLDGLRFKRLTVMQYAYTLNGRAFWRCRCDCGAQTIVTGKSLRSSTTGSCGCLNREIARKNAIIRNKRRGKRK